MERIYGKGKRTVGPGSYIKGMENDSLTVYFAGGQGILTTDHAASSYGQPVLVVNGVAYGPADRVPGGTADTLWGNIALASHPGIELISERPALLRAWSDLADASEAVRAAAIWP